MELQFWIDKHYQVPDGVIWSDVNASKTACVLS